MEFGRELPAIYFACIGFIQVVTGFDVTINGSQPYNIVGRPFMFTCTFDSTATAVRILQKNNIKVQSVQLGGSDCYNVQPAPAVICNPTFCSCYQQGNIFTASWNFTISDTQTNAWKCVEGSSQSSDLILKPAVQCNTTLLTKEQDIFDVGQDIKLSCVTDGCRPRAYIQWYIGNKNATENATVTVTTSNSTEELVRVESKLTLTAEIDHNEQTVSCRAWNFDPSIYVMANDTLNVKEGSDNGGGLSTAEIVGIVIAVVVTVCGVAVFVIYIIFFKNKSRDGKDSEKKKPKGRKSSTVGPIDTPEKKTGNWFKPNCFSVDVTQTGGRDGSVTSRRDVVVDLQDTKTFKGVNSEKSDTPRKLPPLPSIISVTNDQLQEEKPKNKKKKKKKRAKQEQNQQGKDNRAFDNDQTENVPSDDIGNPETNTTPSNNDNIPSDDQGNLETTTPSNNDKISSDDPGKLETTTPSNNNNIPSDDPGNLITTTPSNNHNVPSDDIGNLETTTPRDNHNIPSYDPTNMETT